MLHQVNQDTGIKWEASSKGLVICCLGFRSPVRPFQTWSQVSCIFAVHCQARVVPVGHHRAIAFANAYVLVKHKSICSPAGSSEASTTRHYTLNYIHIPSSQAILCVYTDQSIPHRIGLSRSFTPRRQSPGLMRQRDYHNEKYSALSERGTLTCSKYDRTNCLVCHGRRRLVDGLKSVSSRGPELRQLFFFGGPWVDPGPRLALKLSESAPQGLAFPCPLEEVDDVSCEFNAPCWIRKLIGSGSLGKAPPDPCACSALRLSPCRVPGSYDIRTVGETRQHDLELQSGVYSGIRGMSGQQRGNEVFGIRCA